MEPRGDGVAHRIAVAARTLEQRRTGREPSSVSVILSHETLIIALKGILSKAEEAIVDDAKGATQVEKSHRRLFGMISLALRREVERVTGAKVREAPTSMSPETALVTVHACGTLVMVFRLAGNFVIGYSKVHDGGRQHATNVSPVACLSSGTPAS